MNRLLLAQCYDNTSFFDFSPSRYREYLLEKFPAYSQWFPASVFSRLTELRRDPLAGVVDQLNMKLNIGGSFISENLTTSTTVIHAPATPGLIVGELEKGVHENRPYTHVGFGVFINGYTDFIACAEAVKAFDRRIVTVAGNVGALFDGTERYVDFVHDGDGVALFRELFHEDPRSPYRVALIADPPDSPALYVVSKIGCPHHCDFCVTPLLMKRKAGRPFLPPAAFYEALVARRQRVCRDLNIVVCEPQAIIDPRWWNELFDLFQREKETYTVHFASSAVSLDRFDFERASSSSLKIGIVQLGVESFSVRYDKNSNVDIGSLISKLHRHGVKIYGSFIIGFDHHTRKSIRDEIRKLSELDIDMVSLMNFRPLPKTGLWQKFRRESRIIGDIPADFFYVPGFQAFLHPHFKPGFEDMLPLMFESINDLLDKR